MEYVASQNDDLRTEDISRISYQLLTAIDHCAQHNILHRDLKAENIMFTSTEAGAELRVIDFGSGCMDNKSDERWSKDGAVFGRHTTYAGTAFYSSPEMFRNIYTQKTDVFSAGVSLYVLTVRKKFCLVV